MKDKSMDMRVSDEDMKSASQAALVGATEQAERLLLEEENQIIKIVPDLINNRMERIRLKMEILKECDLCLNKEQESLQRSTSDLKAEQAKYVNHIDSLRNTLNEVMLTKTQMFNTQAANMPVSLQGMMPPMGVQQPLGVGVQQPLGVGVQQPLGLGVQQPLGGGVQQPLGGGIQQPLGGGIQQPLEGGVQQPMGGSVQQPQGGYQPLGAGYPTLGGVHQSLTVHQSMGAVQPPLGIAVQQPLGVSEPLGVQPLGLAQQSLGVSTPQQPTPRMNLNTDS
eukprot:GHVL01018834.1.p1 GENE.GHVL01018834.1~~GHVL01018834.1.p1  ORF type:complete len:279 (-),score=84.49 GHVL01018834.1:62-898(-)